MSTISVNGITVDYSDTGTGTALLLVHGHPFDRSMWTPQLTWPGWRVVAPDLRGYGASTVVPGVTPLGAFADDLAALADALGIDRFVLGGLSMGGQVVLECVRRFPSRIRGLLLADTSAPAETPQGKASRNAIADRVLRDGMADHAAELLPKMVAPDADPQVKAHVLAMMRAAPPEGAAAALRGRAERPDYTDLLGAIQVPTLVVVGSADEFTPVSEAVFLSDRVPGSTLAVIDGAGHLPNLERPAEFNQALAALLGQVAA